MRMSSLNCFRPYGKKKKKTKKYRGGKGSVEVSDDESNVNALHVKLDHLRESSETNEVRSTSFSVEVPFPVAGNSRCEVKVMNHERADSGEIDYEGGDENDETCRLKRDQRDPEFNFQPFSGNIVGNKSSTSLDVSDVEFNFQPCFPNSDEEKRPTLRHVNSSYSLNIDDDNEESNADVMFGMNASGHLSDPGTGKAKFWASPELKRSCSNLALRSICRELEDEQLLSKCKSYEDMQRIAEMHNTDNHGGDGGSPVSIRTRCSADKVMLKKHSSSQILPSGSKKLWWKLFLWSHRNLHRTADGEKPLLSEVQAPPLNQCGGYCSDTVEPKLTNGRSLRSPSSLTEDSNGRGKRGLDDKKWGGLNGTWPQNQWLAFPPDSAPMWRVNEWVKEASSQPPCLVENDDHDPSEDAIHFPSSPENVAERNSSSQMPRPSAAEDISHANSVIRSLTANSSVAHITSLGLATIPMISQFSSLRSINLSGNLIVHVTPGSLPKGLHVLNLSRNKISTIEGLRELTRLRVLDLSYNRISRIGQGLSNCILIKELYLSGNKISVVEGLHRLLKLTVLDLSFNKITTAKALGQLVANYSSLIAVNLLGNPIQSNMSEELLRKTLCSLLPKLALLNKQPTNLQKAREIRTDAHAKAALGSGGLSGGRRKVARKVATNGASSSSSVRRSAVSTSHKSKHRSRTHTRHHSNLKEKA